MTEVEIRKTLRDMRDDPVPPDSIARVRMAVSERQSRKPRFQWLAALMAAAALAMLFVVLRPDPISVPAVPTAIQPVPAVTAAESQPPVRKAVVAKKLKPPRSAVKRQAEPLVVRIETEDPDVVILLIGD